MVRDDFMSFIMIIELENGKIPLAQLYILRRGARWGTVQKKKCVGF